ncbi:MAG TPA: aminotransferase, partial [Candidatus Corynebacterium faecipullorum]|nr:aminotransferase [Candidatus Corynebacterium faecipullorum]
MSLLSLDADQLKELAERIRKDYAELKAKGLQLNLTRGKPSKAQSDLANDLLSLPGEDNYTDAAGNDLRNYGNLDGIREVRELWGKLLGIPAENLVAADSSSLNIMFDLISFAHTW